MCGVTYAVVKDKNFGLFVGFLEGRLGVGDKDSDVFDVYYTENCSKEQRAKMRKELLDYDKEDLVEVLLQFVENSDEG